MRRFATTVIFFANGALFASVLPHLPAIKERAGLDDPGLGLAVAAASAGALAIGPLTGRMTRRFGAGPLAVACTLVYCCALWLPAVAGSLLVVAAVFALFGVLDATIDVAMNTIALSVQASAGRPMINGFHAWWSVGAVAASAVASLAASRGLPVAGSLAAVGAVIAVATLSVLSVAWRERPPTAERSAQRSAGRIRLSPRMLLLGAVALLAALAEDVPSTWSAVYLEDVLGTGAGSAASAYLAFVTAMTVGRLVNDRLVERFGTAVVRVEAGLFAAAIVAVAVTQQPVVAVVAFAAAGLGVSSLFPTALAAAGADGEDATAGNLAYVTWLGRVGFLLAPVVVGTLSGLVGLRGGILVGAAAGVALIAILGTRHRS